MKLDNTKLVIFDLGRVLVHLCDSWQHACEVAGIEVPTGEFDSTRNARLLDVVSRSEIGAIDLATFCNEAAPFLRLTPDEVRAISDSYLLGCYPGVNDLLDDIHAVGLKTACLSNTNANHWRMMTDPTHANAIPTNKLDYLFASQLMGARKPDDAIYEHVERVTELHGDAIAFFDDLQPNIDAALKRGWNAILIEMNGDPVQQVRKQLLSRV